MFVHTLILSTLTVPGQFGSIQGAIDAAVDGDTIQVSPGTYSENINFNGKNVAVVSTGGASVTTVDGGGIGTVVTFESGEGPDAVLDGFTVRGGVGTRVSSGLGVWPGGIACYEAGPTVVTNPTIRNCVVTGNRGGDSVASARAGAGGIGVRTAHPSLENCVVVGNRGGDGSASSDGEPGPGGVLLDSSYSTVSGCVIEGNIGGDCMPLNTSFHGGAGGVLVISDPIFDTPRIQDCIVRRNAGGDANPEATAGAGGVELRSTPWVRVFRCLIEGNVGGGGSSVARAGDGGISVVNSGAEIDSCVVRLNRGGSPGAPSGGDGGVGGVFVRSGSPFVPSLVVNCIVTANCGGDGSDAAGSGGIGIYRNRTVISNCTIVGNVAGSGFREAGGGITGDVVPDQRYPVTNSIVWGNSGPPGATQDQIVSSPNPFVRHSIVEGGHPGMGNLDVDPLFVDASGNDYHLSCSSPAIDAGTDTEPGLPMLDIDGDPRPVGEAVDIGADERNVVLGDNYCVAAANSVGSGALISADGCSSVQENLLTLQATGVPDTPGIFFFGTAAIQVAFGNGFRCVGGATRRTLPIQGVGGSLTRRLHLPWTPITGGSTWYFQAWYRDGAAGGSAFNLSDGLQVDFEP